MPPVLQVRDLSMRYANGFRALNQVDLTVEQGEMIAIVGRSGAGKSTLLRLMNRLLRPTAGTILLHGDDVTRVSGGALRGVRRRVGMIFQQFNLVSRLTVLQNVLTGWMGGTRGWSTIPATWRQFPAEARERALACLEEVQIADLAGHRADELSGGQAQRVAIARVLAQQPSAILADEPIASLDPRSSELVLEILARINRERGVPVVMNLHHTDVATRWSSRIIGLKQGRMEWDLPAGEVQAATLAALYEDNRISVAEPVPLELRTVG